MTRIVWAGVAVAFGLAGVAVAAPPAHITAALADKARPAADTARDAARKPAELLTWAGVKPGDKVVDLMMGGGYFTRILAPAVGPNGHVYAYQAGEFIRFRAAYGTEQDTVVKDYKNVTAKREPFSAFDLPDGLDMVFTVQNYHDLHLPQAPPETAQKVNAEIFKSLKPGGTYVIVDHVAPAGSGLEPPGKTHRIDPAIIRKEVEAAGFRFAGESDLYRNRADPGTTGVFDPSVRGKTDQVAYKFTKPR